MLNSRFKVVVGAASKVIGEGEDGIDAAKKHRVEGMDEPPRPGRCEILFLITYLSPMMTSMKWTMAIRRWPEKFSKSSSFLSGL